MKGIEKAKIKDLIFAGGENFLVGLSLAVGNAVRFPEVRRLLIKNATLLNWGAEEALGLLWAFPNLNHLDCIGCEILGCDPDLLVYLLYGKSQSVISGCTIVCKSAININFAA